ncbi:MAG: hypothetical protein HC817_10280 [Saprospiraceae bacterium]|nr:hypothetical protein [Saprospiraceae bacterium]
MFKTFVIKQTSGAGKIKAFCELLTLHKIKFGKIKTTRAATGYHYAAAKDNTPLSISDEDLVISAYQPLAMLTQILLEPEPEVVDSNTYDITAWSLLHAFGLEAFALKERIDPTEIFEYKKLPITEKNTDRAYAYVAEWNGLNNARFVQFLLQKSIKIRAASADFEVGGKKFKRGSLIITRGDNPSVSSNFDSEITAAALRHEQIIAPIKTGFVDKGYDLGSGHLELLNQPTVAIIFDDDIDNNSYGQMWHFFERDLNMAVTQLKLTDLGRARIGNFNVICMTDGSYANLDSAKIEKLRQWVADGGRLILIGDAVAAFEDKKGFEITKFVEKRDRDFANEIKTAEDSRRKFMHFDEFERDAISDGNPGCIYKLKMDNSHPLAYGLSDYYFSLKTSGMTYPLLKNAYNVGYVDGSVKPLGFIGNRLKKQMPNTAVFATQTIRRGSVIYMVDNPLYRAFGIKVKCLWLMPFLCLFGKF